MNQSSARESNQIYDSAYIPMNIRLIRRVMGIGKTNGRSYTIDDTPVNHISLVARLIEFDEKQGSIEVKIEDETGNMKCRIFKQPSKPKVRAIAGFVHTLNTYVQILGNIMNFSNEDLIIIDRITNIQEYHLVVHHRSQVIKAYLIRKGLIHTPNPLSAVQNLEQRFGEVDSRNPPRRNSDAEDMQALSENQKKIIWFVRSRDGCGVKIEDILGSVRLPRNDVLGYIDQLIEIGYMFTGGEKKLYYST